MCGIRVIFSTLKVFISLIDTSLMIATIKMHEKDMWRIVNCSADLCNSREISMHFDMKIIEIDFKEKTDSKSRTIDESYCPAAKGYKTRISSEFFNYSN